MVISVDATRQYTVHRSGRSGPAMLLAILMHVLLGVFLFLGLNWQSHAPEVIQAEIWSALPQIAAPAQTAPPPQPVPVEQPKPVEVVPPPPPPVQPEIVIKEPVKKPPEKVAPPPPPPPPPLLQQKIEPKPIKPPPPAKALPPSDVAMLQAEAGTPSTGTATQTSGPKGNPGYATKIASMIRTRISLRPTGNPTVVITIQLLPSGEVRDVQIKQSSGQPAFDNNVVGAVSLAAPYPKDTDGKVPPTMDLYYKFDPNQP
jgi:colicin import membrane protein